MLDTVRDRRDSKLPWTAHFEIPCSIKCSVMSSLTVVSESIADECPPKLRHCLLAPVDRAHLVSTAPTRAGPNSDRGRATRMGCWISSCSESGPGGRSSGFFVHARAGLMVRMVGPTPATSESERQQGRQPEDTWRHAREPWPDGWRRPETLEEELGGIGRVNWPMQPRIGLGARTYGVAYAALR